MRKLLSLCLALALAVITLTACGGSEEKAVTEKESNGDVTLNFYVWTGEEKYIQRVIDEYEAANPGVHIELTVVSGENTDYEEKIQMIFTNKDSSVDLLSLRGTAHLAELANGGVLSDLTEYISSGNVDISNYGPMWDSSAINGRFYAMPTRATCWVLYYNKDILDAAGIPYPTEQLTWKEYADLCDEIYVACKDKGVTAKDGTEVKGGMLVDWVLDYYSIQNNVYLNSDDLETIQDGLEMSKEIYSRESCYSYAEVSAIDFDYLADFENGRAALMPNGEWMVNMFMEDNKAGKADFKWGVSYMPIPEGVEEHTTFGDFQYVGVSEFSEKKDASFDFLAYLTGENGAKIYSEENIIHAFSSDAVIESYKQTTGNDTVSVFFESKKIQETPVDNNYDAIKQAFVESGQLYLLDETGIEECMETFQERRLSILSR